MFSFPFLKKLHFILKNVDLINVKNKQYRTGQLRTVPLSEDHAVTNHAECERMVRVFYRFMLFFYRFMLFFYRFMLFFYRFVLFFYRFVLSFYRFVRVFLSLYAVVLC